MARYQLRVGAAACALALLCGACTSSSNNPPAPNPPPASPAPTTPSPTPASPTRTAQGTAEMCSAYAALKTSLHHLVTLNVLAGGMNGLTSAIDDVKQKAAALGRSSGEFTPQVNALNAAIRELEGTVHDLSNGGSLATALPNIGRQVAAVGSAGERLASAVRHACPSSASS